MKHNRHYDPAVFRLSGIFFVCILILCLLPSASAYDLPDQAVKVEACPGILNITSFPAGATVYLDSGVQGKTPLTRMKVLAGRHTLRLRLNGYLDATDDITVLCDSTTTKVYYLIPVVTTTPTGVAVEAVRAAAPAAELVPANNPAEPEGGNAVPAVRAAVPADVSAVKKVVPENQNPPSPEDNSGNAGQASSGLALKVPVAGMEIRDKSPLDSISEIFAGAVFCQMKTFCDGTCTDTKTDLNNCGGCGNVCPPGPAGSRGAAECSNGQCIEHTCSNGLLYCSGQCINAMTDTANCGSCGVKCSPCANGQCQYQKDTYFSSNIDLTPQITQQRYFTSPGDNIYGPDHQLISLGDGYADPSGWFVGFDSTLCTWDNAETCIPIIGCWHTGKGIAWGIPSCDARQEGAGTWAVESYDITGFNYQTIDYRVRMNVDTSQFAGKPVKQATLDLKVIRTIGSTFNSVGDIPTGRGQTVHEVWYKKTDPFPVSSPEAFSNLDPYLGVYLSGIPTQGTGFNLGASPPDYGTATTGGTPWGSSGTTPSATWDPQTQTLSIDMTALVNKWITGELPNYGFVLKDGPSMGPRTAQYSVYSFDSFQVVP